MAIVAEDVFPSDMMDLGPGKPGIRFRVIATSFKIRVHGYFPADEAELGARGKVVRR